MDGRQSSGGNILTASCIAIDMLSAQRIPTLCMVSAKMMEITLQNSPL